MVKGDYTKAKGITLQTKEKVFKRQHGRSLLSNIPITVNQCCCHVLGRGRGGVGYEWNIIGLTYNEHRLLDENKPIYGVSNDEVVERIKDYLRSEYDGWSEEKCHYHKYFKEADYGVTRRNSA